MKRGRLLFLISCSVCLLFPISPSDAAGNLLNNPGFEKGLGSSPAGWSSSVGDRERYDPSEVIFRWDDIKKESGNYSVMIKRASNRPAPARWFQTVHTEGGTDYMLTVSYRVCDDFSGPANIMIRGFGVDRVAEYIPPSAPGSEGTWKKLHLSFRTLQAGRVRVYLQHMGTGSIWYDNAELKKGTPQDHANLITNPRFEEVTSEGIPAGGWWIYPRHLDPDIAEISVDTDKSYAGEASLRFEMKSRGAATMVSPEGNVNPGDELYFSVYYRSKMEPVVPDAEELAEEARSAHRWGRPSSVKAVLAYRNNVGHNWLPEDIPAEPVTEDWRKLEGTFKVPAGAERTEARFNVTNYTGSIWWDDLVIRKLNPYSLNLSPYEEDVSPGINSMDFVFENYTGARGPLTVEVSVKGHPPVSVDFTPSGAASEDISIEYEVRKAGDAPVEVRLLDPRGRVLFEAEKTLNVADVMRTTTVVPRYVWPERDVEEVRIDVHKALSAGELKNAELEIITFDGTNRRIGEFELSGPQTSTRYKFPVSGLEPGDYRMEISLKGEGGEIAVGEELFKIMDYSRPEVEVKDGRLIVEGEPFFPIGMFQPSVAYYQEYSDAGFNFAHNYGFSGDAEGGQLNTIHGCLSVMDRAHAAGLWFVVTTPRRALIHQDWDFIRERLEAFKDHPAVLAYEQEEQIVRYALSLRAARRWRDLVRELDPERPVLWGDLPYAGADGKRYFPFEVMDSGDMAIWWWYPFPLPPGQTEILIPEWMTTNIPISEKPIWVAPQSWSNPTIPDGRFPLPEEYRVQAYLAIIHGADGLMYFGGHIFSRLEEAHWEDLKEVVGELRDLSPVILAPDSDEEVKVEGGDKISVLLKEHEGRYYLLAANRDASESDVSFILPFSPSRINVLHEDRQTVPERNMFRDTFGEYEVHVYEIMP